MNTLELKNDLLRLLVETDDTQLLEKVRRYFKLLKHEPVSDAILEAQELAMVEVGLAQIEKGQVMTHEEARKKIEARLYNKRQ
jgi:predicted transcriptional regulator